MDHLAEETMEGCDWKMKRNLVLVLLAVVLVVGVHTVLAGTMVDEKAVLSGTVTWTVETGATVQEGSELVRIATLTGSVAAARSSTRGTVQDVLVHNGDTIKNGTVVARIAKKN